MHVLSRKSFSFRLRWPLISFFTSLFLFGFVGFEPVQAATCAISSATVIDQAYVDTNSCGSINIQGSVSTTWIGTVDLQGSGTVTVKSTYTMTVGTNSAIILGSDDDFVVEANATTTHNAQDTNGLKITARNITVTGALSGSGKGCPQGDSFGNAGYGVNTATGACAASTGGYGRGGGGSGQGGGGGSYGGTGGGGGPSASGGTIVYGNALAPNYFGSGGGTGYYTTAYGGAGGGIVHVTSTEILTVNGSITSNGANGLYESYNGGGGGAGGSILVHAGTLAGSGRITANGGAGGAGGAGGGGGRTAVFYGIRSGFNLSLITSAGGAGGAGGLWGNGVNGAVGSAFALDRYLDDGAGTFTITSGFDFPSGGDYTRDTVTISSGALLGCSVATVTNLSSISWLTFNNVTWNCLRSVNALNISSAAGISTTSTAFTFTSVSSSVAITAPYWTNVTTTFSMLAGASSTWDISSDLTLRSMVYRASGAGSISANGGWIVIKNVPNLGFVSSTVFASVSSTGLSSLSIDALSTIDATGIGCAAGNGGENGYGPNTTTRICGLGVSGYGKNGNGAGGGGGGASHAGSGGNGNGGGGAQATIYGTTSTPVLPGSGGGGGYWVDTAPGGAGGGVIHFLVSGIISISGSIKANGVAGTYGGSFNGGGGGSGGSIFLRAGTITGSGSITANGGAGASTGGGGGGGGRIALVYSTNSFSGTSSTALGTGGTSAGSGTAGSIYLFATNQSPTAPASLGPTALVNGSTTGTTTPTLSFVLADPDVSDTVKYQLQIDDSSDFSSPIVDYTSALAAQGSRTFQVGQAEGSGLYTVGTMGQTLSNGSYYWRVKAIDAASAASSYVSANSGAVAFVIDATARTVQFDASSASASEAVTSTSFKITLNTTHFTDVTVDYTVSGGTGSGGGVDYTLASGTATILAGQTSTTVPLTIVNDAISEPDETIVITLSNPINASLGTTTVFTYTITDNDTVGVTVTESSGSTAASEGGATDLYTVVLDSEPTSTVRISFTTSTNGVALDVGFLDFTSMNWNIPQNVIVTATDDVIAEGEHADTIIFSVTTPDGFAYGYDGISVSSIPVTITDNDAAGVSVSSVSGVATEGGGSASYTLVLTSQPTSTVSIALMADPSVMTLSSASLSFTSSNWNVPQTVTVSAVDDAISTPTYATSVTHIASSSFSLGYDSGLSISAASVNVVDNDAPGVTITESDGSINVSEGGATDSYTVVLDSAPTSTVRISFATTTYGVVLNPGFLDFTSVNWNVPQTVSVTATDDAIYEGAHTDSIISTVTVPTGFAYGYAGISVAAITANITDNDTAGVPLSTTSVALIEGETGSYTVVFSSRPTSSVELTLTSSNASISLSPSTLTFTPSDWDVPQTVQVIASDNIIADGAHTSIIHHAVSVASLPGYPSDYYINDVTVTIADNDSSGGGATAASSGTSASLAQPVTFTYAPSTGSETQSPISTPILEPQSPTSDPGNSVSKPTSPAVLQDAQIFKISLTPVAEARLASFIQDGSTEATRLLGSGERRAMIRDSFDTMRQAPSLQDLERLASGQIPLTRNLGQETIQLPRVRQTFRTIFGHDPIFSRPDENLAWNTLMYRIRFPRNLSQERSGITEFRATFNKAPQDPFQWSVVRVLGYIK